MNTDTLLVNIEKNHMHIKTLLRTKAKTIKKVQSAMDEKARTKTPLTNRQQRIFHEFTGLYAMEGGRLKEYLMRIEHIPYVLHTEKDESFMFSLLLLQRHQSSAIKSLRRIIEFSFKILNVL